jgi:methyl-accepting chemotaxis protein PixJ
VLPEQQDSNQKPINSGRPTTDSSFMSWFNNLPIRRKQLLALITSELITVVGLMGVGSWLIINSGRTQLLEQAKSELAVMGTTYDIKINQMGFGFRGQSENSLIIQAAKDYDATKTLSADLQAQLRGILANEVKARNIEYATLVGTDLRIISSANAKRFGEKFDPQGLVSSVLANPQQLNTSAIVNWTELQKENPPLPKGFENQAGLIRYVVTPVKDPQANRVIGALVSGDLVNYKLSIVQTPLAAFRNGYSAVYLRQPDGAYQLATSLYGSELADSEANGSHAMSNLALPTTQILDQAVAAAGNPVTQRLPIGKQTYMVAAKAVLNFQDQPVAVLVRGSSESALNAMLRQSLLVQLGIVVLVVAVDILLARMLGGSIAAPIERLSQIALKFSQGDRQVRARGFAKDEVGELAGAFNELATNVANSESSLRHQSQQQQTTAERAKLLSEIAMQIRRSSDPEEIFAVSVEGVQAILQTDRVVIYRFNSDFTSGYIAAESVGAGWIKALGKTIHDPLNPMSLERYRTGRISRIENLATAPLSRCHCEILERLEVQANIVAPIMTGEELLGLLCAHQCSGPRLWTAADVEVMQQLSMQIGYALAQVQLLQRQRATAERERQINLIVTKMRETLQPQQIYNTTLQEIRQVLAADRAIVYLFDQKWEGTIVAESVADDYLAALGAQIADPCFADKYIEKYRKGRVQSTPDIRQAGLTECHIQQLEAFQVKANLVAPILAEEKLLGLLIVHQCSGPRQWQESDLRFMRQIAIQLGFALEQADLFSQKEQSRLATETLLIERQRQQEQWQRQLVDLLGHVEGAARGDLTVRAEVTAGEIGTVADFFNAIIESLRQIVMQVKHSAVQVNLALGENEEDVKRLAKEAYEQANATTQILDSVEQMTGSIQTVAENAQQAAQVARTASITAETGGVAMDMTVHNILSLRETIGDTAKKVKRLGESSQQISQVVSLINQIALQTNLLAINAGIEAARAGEDGQGFAIVAEEVGELAARSAEATYEIEKVVATIQRETSQVVEAMEHSTERVVEGTKLVEEAKHSLQQIVEVSRQIDTLVQAISEATVSQASTSMAVSRVMQQATQVSEHTSQSSRQVAMAIQQTVTIAQQLQASVEAFTVSKVSESGR